MCLRCPNDLFPFVRPITIPYAFLICMYEVHLILNYLIILVTFVEEYKLLCLPRILKAPGYNPVDCYPNLAKTYIYPFTSKTGVPRDSFPKSKFVGQLSKEIGWQVYTTDDAYRSFTGHHGSVKTHTRACARTPRHRVLPLKKYSTCTEAFFSVDFVLKISCKNINSTSIYFFTSHLHCQ
jgi:hypothetical protein